MHSKDNSHTLKLADGLKAVGRKYDIPAGYTALAWMLGKGRYPCHHHHYHQTSGTPVSRSDRPRIVAETANILRNLKENMSAGRSNTPWRISKQLERS
jgi:hypothetical protein